MFLYSTPDNKIYDSLHRQLSAVNSFLWQKFCICHNWAVTNAKSKELGTFTQSFNKSNGLDARSCASLLHLSFSLQFQSQCLCRLRCLAPCMRKSVRSTTLPLASVSIIISTSPLWIRGKERITACSVNYLGNAALYNLQKPKLCCYNHPPMFHQLVTASKAECIANPSCSSWRSTEFNSHTFTITTSIFDNTVPSQ
jgi:hypothetical protein